MKNLLKKIKTFKKVIAFISAILLISIVLLFKKDYNPIIIQDKTTDNIIQKTNKEIDKYYLTIQKGDTLISLLSELGATKQEIIEIIKKINPLCKLSELQPNKDKLVVYIQSKSDNEKIKSIEIIKNPLKKIICFKTENGFDVLESNSKVIEQYTKKTGIITKGSSLIEIAIEQGVPYNIIDKFYEIFSFDIDFERDIRPDDKFTILYKELYSDKGDYLEEGDVIYASLYLNARKTTYKLYRYENKNSIIAYYDEDGKGALKTLKKTPINGARISSTYGRRKHPILGYSKSHKGVDFAAPMGTPIPAGGSGKIIFKGWRGGYGNYIKIKHNATYSTAYGHLSRFNNSLTKGSYVKMGQIIGYVGSTGMSTGPHLHYEIIKNGTQVNPLTIKLPSISNLTNNELTNFENIRNKVNMQLTILSK